MNPIGHVGLTLGLAFIANRVVGWTPEAATGAPNGAPEGATQKDIQQKPLNYWLVAAGALLPDLIDKPLAFFVLHDAGTRTYGHTLAFSLALCVAGAVLLLATGRMFGLVVAGGSLMHLVLDGMWTMPQVLYWPLLGTAFPFVDGESVLDMLQHALQDPGRAMSDMVGLVVLAVVLIRFVVERRSRRKRQRDSTSEEDGSVWPPQDGRRMLERTKERR